MRVGERRGAEPVAPHQRREPRQHHRQLARGRLRGAPESALARAHPHRARRQRDMDDRRPRRMSLKVETEQREHRGHLVHRVREVDAALVPAAVGEAERERELIGRDVGDVEPCRQPLEKRSRDGLEGLEGRDLPLEPLDLLIERRRRVRAERRRVEAPGEVLGGEPRVAQAGDEPVPR
jgi:hypothetical protein